VDLCRPPLTPFGLCGVAARYEPTGPVPPRWPPSGRVNMVNVFCYSYMEGGRPERRCCRSEGVHDLSND
jgi:hypothetical protein